MQFAQSENAGIMYAARKACTYIEKFKGRIVNSLGHNRIVQLAIEVFYSEFVLSRVLFLKGYGFRQLRLPLVEMETYVRINKRMFRVSSSSVSGNFKN